MICYFNIYEDYILTFSFQKFSINSMWCCLSFNFHVLTKSQLINDWRPLLCNCFLVFFVCLYFFHKDIQKNSSRHENSKYSSLVWISTCVAYLLAFASCFISNICLHSFKMWYLLHTNLCVLVSFNVLDLKSFLLHSKRERSHIT